MIKQIFDGLKSLNFETALLEAVDWDEDAQKEVIETLSLYFQTNAKDKTPDQVKNDLAFLFTKDICKILYEYIDYFTMRIVNEKGNLDYEA